MSVSLNYLMSLFINRYLQYRMLRSNSSHFADTQMNPKILTTAKLFVSENYIKQGEQGRKSREKLIQTLLDNVIDMNRCGEPVLN